MFAVPVRGGRKRRAECVCVWALDGGVRAGEMPPPPTFQARRGLQGGEDIVLVVQKRRRCQSWVCLHLSMKEGERQK